VRDQDQSDPSRDFHRLLNLPPAAGLEVFNDTQLASQRPIALRLFSAPCSSAASERVFSQSGLIMKPTRSRLSKSRLAQLVFLKCNNHLK
jgi:hAT family C-terminal dimerisation region